MIPLLFISAISSVSTGIILSYSSAKYYWWYLPVGGLLGLISQCSWMSIAKLLTDEHRKIFFIAFFYNISVMLAAVLIPILIFKVRMTSNNIVGVIIILVGVIVMKAK